MASGPINSPILLYAILLISISGALTDLFYGKIFNWLTFPALAMGLGASVYFGGWQGFLAAFLAVGVGLLVYGWMFALGVMGAGDVKFLMALGAWGGFRFVVETALAGVLIGGAFAVLMLLFKGQLVGFYRRMHWFFLTLVLSELEVEKPKINHSFTMPFGVPIAIAATWVAFGHPFEQMGVHLWSG